MSQALLLSARETRMIVSVDMTRMCKVLWVDKTNMLACIESGIIGMEIDKYLA